MNISAMSIAHTARPDPTSTPASTERADYAYPAG